MATFKRILPFAAFAFLLAACSQSSKVDPAQAAKAQKLAGKYMGITPCADCEGIEYTVTLNPDFTYTASMIYKGKSTDPFSSSGKWSYSADDKIKLEMTPPQGMNQFEVGDNQITMLDQQGNKITGALADRYILYREGFAPPPSPHAKKKEAGINFIGMGTEPFWVLDIDFEKSMQFNVLGGDTINAPAVNAKNWSGGNLVYEAKTDKGTLNVAIRKEACNDGMSDNQYEYSVTVKSGNKEYKGCGIYLAGSLGSLWTLKSINGAAPDSAAFMRGRPVLQIDAPQGRYSGTDGCNTINGKITMDGGKTTFSPGPSTMMACPGNGAADYVKALFGVTEYKLTDTELTLLTDGKPVLVYGL